MMFSRHPLPRHGDKLLHSRQRDLVRDLWAARAIQGEGAIQTDITGTGAYLTQPRAPVLGLFEIRDLACDWRWEERSSSGWPYHWHYTVGRPILYYYPDGTWSTPLPPMDDDSSSSSSGILDQYIVHPTGYPEPIAEDVRLHDVFTPLYSAGDWVWCVYEAESARWAVHDGYEQWLRFELAGDLSPGRYADAYLLRCQQCLSSSGSSSSGVCQVPATWEECEEEYLPYTGFTFQVHDGLCGWEGYKGQRGYCKFFADSRRFEVVQLPRPLQRFELAEDLPQWSDTPVLAYRRCWNPSAHGGEGGWDTDCDQTFKIADWDQIGYWGYASEGPTGRAELRRCDNGWIGVIRDLRCVEQCKCGETGPGPVCESSSSSSSSSGE